MNRFRNTVLPLGAALSILAACGGPGVSDETRAVDLTPAQREDLCGELAAIFESTQPTDEQICTLGVLGPAMGDTAMCETLRDGCLVMPPEPTEIDCSMAAMEEFDPGCAATVGELRLCWDAMADNFVSVYGRAICTNAGTDQEPSITEISMMPAACAPLAGCGMTMP